MSDLEQPQQQQQEPIETVGSDSNADVHQDENVEDNGEGNDHCANNSHDSTEREIKSSPTTNSEDNGEGNDHCANTSHDSTEREIKSSPTNNSSSAHNTSQKIVGSEPEQLRKLFVGGVNYKTEENTLRNYFGDFGEIVDCVIMRDAGGRSRGFAFVCYDKSICVDQVMKNRPHVIDGRSLDVRRATPKEEAGKPGGQLSVRKLFIGGCREGITDEDLKEYFSKYGSVTDCVVMKDNDGKYRGFGFVTFDDYDPVDKVCLEKVHTINGLSLDVKKAMPKPKPMGGGRPMNSGMHSRSFNDSYGSGGGFDPYDSFSSPSMYGRGSYGSGGGSGGAMRSYGGPMGGGSYYGGSSSQMRSRRSGGGGGGGGSWSDRLF